MKTPLFLLSLFAACGLLAQPTTGIYPSTAWASTQLLVNPKLDTGKLGQAMGYVSNGVIAPITIQAGIPEAPLLSLLYARSNATWQSFPPGLSTMPSDAPNNGLWYSRRNNEWQNFVPGGSTGTNAGGTNRMLVAALAEWRPANTNGTLIPSATNVFIKLNHIYDPDGLFTAVNTNIGSFKLIKGNYAVTMVVPVSVAEQGGGNVRIPFSIGLFNLTTTNDVYYQTYTIYDEDLSQYSQVFMPFLITDGTQEFTIRVVNHNATLDLMAGQAGGVVDNRYSEVQILKLDGIAGLSEAPINGSLYARKDQDWVSFTIPSTNGFIPEAPTDGQTYGRRGSDASWQLVTGGGGADTNAVAAVPDLATLTNSVVGYSKAIVGQTNETMHKLFQAVRSDYVPVPFSNMTGVGGTLTDNGDGSATATGSTVSTVGIQCSTDAVIGAVYRMAWEAKANEASEIFASSYWTNPAWETPVALGTDYARYELTFTANNLDALRITRSRDSTADSITVRNWMFSSASSQVPDGLTSFPSSADPGLIWQQVSLESPGGGNTVSTQVFDSAADQVVPNANVIICDTGNLGAGISLTNRPSILPGFEGQHIRLVIPNKTTAGFFGLNNDDGANGTGVKLGGTSRNLSRYGSLGLYFDGVMWVESDWNQVTSAEVNVLPAPWPPPDANGVQVLPANVKEQLLIELIPYLIANWNRLAPMMTNTTAAP